MSDTKQKNWGSAGGVLLLTILLGPPIGGAVFFVGVLVISLFNGENINSGDILGTFVGSVVLSYLPGGLQAILMGMISAVVVFRRSFYTKLAAAGFAIASNALVLAVIYMRDPLTEGFRPTLLLFGLFTAISVVAAVALQAMFRKWGLIQPRVMAG